MNKEIEVIDAEVVEVVDGEVVEVLDSQPGPNLNFNINEEHITGEDVAYGYTKNESIRNNLTFSHNTYRDAEPLPEEKLKFKTLIYLNKKTVNALNRELDTLKREVLEAYEMAVNSSTIEYQSIFLSICSNSKNNNSEINTAIGNTIYQYKINNLSIDNICDNLSLRFAFSGLNAHTRSLVKTASSMSKLVEGYRYHMNILVPIILDKLNDSWYDLELKQFNTTLGLLTPKLFKSYDINQLNEFYSKECSNGFQNIHSSHKIDDFILEVIIRGLELFRERCSNISLDEDFVSQKTAIDFLELLQKESNELDHIVIEYPTLQEISLMSSFIGFLELYNLDEKISEVFSLCIKLIITQEIEKNPMVRDYAYKDNRDRYSTSQGSIYTDLNIPELFKSWSTIYKMPFSDREVINIFLSNYKKICISEDIRCSLSDDNPIGELLSGVLSLDEYNSAITFLNKSIYSRRNPITVIGEYVRYICNLHDKLEIPEPICKYDNDSIYEFTGYLSDKVSFIDQVFADSLSDKFNIKCDCGIVTDSEFMEVNDYLTTIRIDPNRSSNNFSFDFESTMSLNIELSNSQSDNFSDIGKSIQETSSFVDQTLAVCPECGKIHIFKEGEYRALDICAQKFLSSRNNSDMSKFVQRCALSRSYLASFSNEFYSYFASLGMSDNLPLDLPEVVEDVKDEAEEDKKDFSQFDIMATNFIDNIFRNKDQYAYESTLRELKMNETQDKDKPVDIGSILKSIKDIDDNLDNDNQLGSLDSKHKILNGRYYNNFIWYFLSNNLRVNFSVVDILKLRISEVLGESRICEITKLYYSMKTTLSKIGKIEFEDIKALNNSSSFNTIDILGDLLDTSEDIDSISDDDVKLYYKYINLARRAFKNSESVDEFSQNLDKCNIEGKLLKESIKNILLDEYQSSCNFDYSNKELMDKLIEVSDEGIVTLNSLYNELYGYRNRISEILDSVNFSKPEEINRFYTDFDLDEMCVIIGCHLIKSELSSIDMSRYLNSIKEFEDKLILRLVDGFNEFDDGAKYYLQYILGIVDLDLNYSEVYGTELTKEFVNNYGLVCREYIKPSNIKLDANIKLTEDFKNECVAEICHSSVCKYSKRLVNDIFKKGVILLVDSIENNFKDFAFRILEEYPIDLYNSRLVNSVLGKGLNKLIKGFSTPNLSDELSTKILLSFPSRDKIFPRVDTGHAQKLFNSIKKDFENNAENIKFKVMDKDGSVVSNPKILNKLRSNIFTMFTLMDIEKCLYKDSSYERDIFKVFNMIFNLPSSIISNGLREEISELELTNYRLDYDYLYEHINSLCSDKIVKSCLNGSIKLNHSLEKSQIEEFIIVSKLCVDTSVIPYRAWSGLISSELSSYK